MQKLHALVFLAKIDKKQNKELRKQADAIKDRYVKEPRGSMAACEHVAKAANIQIKKLDYKTRARPWWNTV